MIRLVNQYQPAGQPQPRRQLDLCGGDHSGGGTGWGVEAGEDSRIQYGGTDWKLVSSLGGSTMGGVAYGDILYVVSTFSWGAWTTTILRGSGASWQTGGYNIETKAYPSTDFPFGDEATAAFRIFSYNDLKADGTLVEPEVRRVP